MQGIRKVSLWAVTTAIALFVLVQVAGADTVGSTPVTVGLGPTQAQLSPDSSKLIVSNETSNNVSVISTATDSVVATVPAGTDPGPIRYLPNGSRAYVANFLSNNVSVIDMTTNTLATTVPVGKSPITLSVSQDGSKVWVVNEESNTVSVISTATNTVSKTVNVGAGPYGVNANGANPADLAVNPGAGKVYVANNATKNVAVIDENVGVNQHKVIGMIAVGTGPKGVALDTALSPNRLFVSTDTADKLYIIDASTNAIITTANTGTGPSGVAVDQTTHRVYVANLGTSTSIGNTVSVIDGTTGSTIATVAVGDGPSNIAVNPSNHKVYVTNNGTSASPGNTVSVIDGNPANLATVNTVLATITVGGYPRGVAVNSATNRIYVANGGSTSLPGNTVSVINGATDSVLGSPIVVGSGPSRVGVNQATNTVYVTNNWGPGTSVSVIDGASGTVSATVPVGSGPSGVAVNAISNVVYVGNKVSNAVSVIDGATNTEVDTDGNAGNGMTRITVGSSPHSIARSPDGTRIYIANQYSNTITVMDAASDSVLANVAVDPSPGSIHFLPNGSKLYVANRGCADSFECSPLVPPTISVINPATNSLLGSIAANVGDAGAAPHSMRITPDGSKLYLANKHTNEIKVVSTSTDAVVATIPITTGICSSTPAPADPAKACPLRLEATHDGGRIYVVDEAPTQSAGSVSVICTGIVPVDCGGFSADTVMATLSVGNNPVDIEIDCPANKAYVTDSGSAGVSVITLTGMPACSDADGDGVPDATDNCPAWANPAQQLPPWTVPAGDRDCDGFPDSTTVAPRGRENFIGTDIVDQCADTTTPNDERGPAFGEPLSPWPPDFNDNRVANLSDVVAFGTHFNTVAPNPAYSARFDLNASNSVNLSDVVAIGPFFNKSCTP